MLDIKNSIWRHFSRCTGTCPYDGAIRDPTDCAKYYLCWDGVVLRKPKSCPTGMLFSSVTKLCDRAGVVNCNSDPSSTSAPTTKQPTTIKPTTTISMKTTTKPTTSTTTTTKQTTTTPKPPTTKPTTAVPATGRPTSAPGKRVHLRYSIHNNQNI